MLCVIIVALLHKGSSTTYFVKSDDEHYSINSAHTLSHYLMNRNKYFTSHTKLQFLPGMHILQSDMVLQDVKNFTICGNDSIIHCNGLAITAGAVNVTNLTICNIEFANCGKRGSKALKHNHETVPYYNHSGVLYFNCCTTVKIIRVTITANSDVSGIVAINVFATEVSSFVDVRIALNCGYPDSNSSPVNGIEFYYIDVNNETHNITNYTATIRHYNYKNNKLCNSSYALFLALFQESYGISMVVQDTTFSQLYNTSVLYYHKESVGQYIDNSVTFNNCIINNNFGNIFLKMFNVLIYNAGFIYSKSRHQRKCDTQSNIIAFNNCHFVNNSNMNSLLYLDPKNTLLFNVLVKINHSSFLYNCDVQMIKVNSEVTALWQLSHYITITETTISSNKHDNLVSLISSTNGNIELMNLIIVNNTYETIIRLYLSVLMYNNYVEFSSNYARFIIQAREGSYYLLKEYTTVNITRNHVYTSTTTTKVHNENLDQICYYQFISDRGNLDHEFAVNKTLNYKILFVDNTYSAPHYEINIWTSTNCSWLLETAFYSSVASEVYGTVVETKLRWANKTIRESTKSLVCPCSTEDKFNCKERHLGSLFQDRL